MKVVEPESFWGKLRALYSDKVLKTQLGQMRKQGSIDGFDFRWKEIYNVRPLKGGSMRVSLCPSCAFCHYVSCGTN